MTTTRATLVVTGNASRWWLAIEPAGIELEKPRSPETVSLETGVHHALIYYAQGLPGERLEITIKEGSKTLVKIERAIGSRGFAYGHKGFLP